MQIKVKKIKSMKLNKFKKIRKRGNLNMKNFMTYDKLWPIS